MKTRPLLSTKKNRNKKEKEARLVKSHERIWSKTKMALLASKDSV
jgi:hypothetical protein